MVSPHIHIHFLLAIIIRPYPILIFRYVWSGTELCASACNRFWVIWTQTNSFRQEVCADKISCGQVESTKKFLQQLNNKQIKWQLGSISSYLPIIKVLPQFCICEFRKAFSWQGVLEKLWRSKERGLKAEDVYNVFESNCRYFLSY